MKYMDKNVFSIKRIKGGFRITETTGKELIIKYKDGQLASSVEIKQIFHGQTRKIKLSPHGRKGSVWTFDRTVSDSSSDKGWKQNKVSISALIAECEAYLSGDYSPTYEYNHKLRVTDFRDLSEPERVGSRFGELVPQERNNAHDSLVSIIKKDTGMIISVSAMTQVYSLLTLKKITVSDVLKFKHIKHISPTGKDWYEILV